MNEIEQFFRNMSVDDSDYQRLIEQLKEVLFGQKSIHVFYGTGKNGKTSIIKLFSNILENKVVALPSNAIHSSNIDNIYIPYIKNKEYLVIRDLNDLMVNSTALNLLTNGFSTQYRKPYTNNWNQVQITPKQIIIETNLNPNGSPLTNNNQIAEKANIIVFNKIIQNSDFNLVDDIVNNRFNEVY